MLLLLRFLAGPLLGVFIGGLVDLFWPQAKVQVVQSAGGLTVANVMFWGAIGSFLAYVGIRDKGADAAKPTILSSAAGLIRSAFVAVLTGIYKLLAEAKAKAGG
jgi:hypothetical protein